MLSSDPKAVEIILEQALKEDSDSENSSFSFVKYKLLLNITRNIKKVSTPNSVNAFINVLSSKDKEVVDNAIHNLGILASPLAIEPLEKLLSEVSLENSKLIEKSIKRIKKKNDL